MMKLWGNFQCNSKKQIWRFWFRKRKRDEVNKFFNYEFTQKQTEAKNGRMWWIIYLYADTLISSTDLKLNEHWKLIFGKYTLLLANQIYWRRRWRKYWNKKQLETDIISWSINKITHTHTWINSWNILSTKYDWFKKENFDEGVTMDLSHSALRLNIDNKFYIIVLNV